MIYLLANNNFKNYFLSFYFLQIFSAGNVNAHAHNYCAINHMPECGVMVVLVNLEISFHRLFLKVNGILIVLVIFANVIYSLTRARQSSWLAGFGDSVLVAGMLFHRCYSIDYDVFIINFFAVYIVCYFKACLY